MTRKKTTAAPAAPVKPAPATKRVRGNKIHRSVNIKPLFTSRQQAANALGMSIQNLMVLIRAKELPEYVFGPSCRRILISDLIEYVRTKRQGPPLTEPTAYQMPPTEVPTGYALLD